MKPTITFMDFEGAQVEIEANVGDSLMATAVQNSVDGIEADCGGNCACATCHVYVDEDWFEALGEVTEIELEMIDVVEDRKRTSRLACQVEITEAMNGLVVTTPESQY